MRTLGILAVAMILALGTGIGMPGISASAAQAAGIDEQIANAKTKADHEAIASWYDERAKESEAKAADHEKMGAAYKKAGGMSHKTHFHEHCETLTRQYRAEAKEYQALAAAHRQMAKNVK